ncbi:hypothetical protein CISECK367B_01680 [Citrobacter sedlakii]|nr:hypothetical protein APU02_06895 [Citrobacter sp. 50677481]
MASPGDKFIDGANSIEELNILIAHEVEHLSPQQQAHEYNNNQNDPSKLFHSTLRFNTLWR